MKKLFVLAGSTLVFGTLAFAETWAGTLVDASCSKQNSANHTLACTLKCAGGGDLGIVTADGKFVKFTPAGKTKALAVLQASKKEKDLKGKVTGKMAGDLIEVETVTLD